MDFKELVQKRRSLRQYTEEPLTEEQLKTILRAGLMAPTAMNQRDWHFAVVTNKEKLSELSRMRDHGSALIEGAAAAIAVIGTGDDSKCWVENCSLAVMSMQYQAEDLGLASCWVQVRGRHLIKEDPQSQLTDDYVKAALNLPEDQHCLCVLALGNKASERDPKNEADLLWDSVTYYK